MVCVGRLAPEKNLATLSAAFERILTTQPRAKLVLRRRRAVACELQARCPKPCFAGQRSGDDLAAHYASADLFLFPSLTETFGNVTTEAMASGLPVVAFDYAAAAQLIRDDDNGCLVPFGDDAAFIERAALGSPTTPRGSAGWANAARAQCRVDAGWDGVVARFEACCCRVIRDSRRGGRLPLGMLRTPVA